MHRHWRLFAAVAGQQMTSATRASPDLYASGVAYARVLFLSPLNLRRWKQAPVTHRSHDRAEQIASIIFLVIRLSPKLPLNQSKRDQSLSTARPPRNKGSNVK